MSISSLSTFVDNTQSQLLFSNLESVVILEIFNIQDFLNKVQINSKKWIRIFDILRSNLNKFETHVHIMINVVNAQIVEFMNYQINLEIDISRLEVVFRDKNIYIEDCRAIDNSHISRRFVNVLDSNKFDDFDIKILRDWLLVVRDKLDRNVDHFVEIIANQTRLTRRNYVYERIFDTINNQILLQLHSEFNFFESLFIVENIFVFMKRSYDDSNRRDNAQRKIHDLNIKNRLFLKYLSDFNQYIDDCDYDNTFQLIVFEHDFFSKLKLQLVNITLMKLSKLIKLCQTMNNKLRVINVNFYIKNKIKWFVSFTLVNFSIAFATLNSISNIDSWMFDVLELMNLFVNNVRSSLFEIDKLKNRQHRIINDLCRLHYRFHYKSYSLCSVFEMTSFIDHDKLK